jgi:putative Mg2+ transporter-C (MgtC) family protein
MSILEIEWGQTGIHLVHLMLAYLLALPLGLDREKSRRRFGLRTFPLVAVVSCGLMLVGVSVIDSTEGEARVIQGIITGIGFIGGGAIFKGKGTVAGTATAASIWNTSGIGIAVAFSRFEIAIVLSILNFLTLRYVPQIKDNIEIEE